MEYLVSVLRAIGDQMGLEPLPQVALQPGVQAVYRLIMRYHDRRAQDTGATLVHRGRMGTTLMIVYRGLFGQRPVTISVSSQVHEQMAQGLQRLRFDHLRDQSDLQTSGIDLWLLERAASRFAHSVILSPETASGPYAELVDLIRQGFGQAVKEVHT